MVWCALSVQFNSIVSVEVWRRWVYRWLVFIIQIPHLNVMFKWPERRVAIRVDSGSSWLFQIGYITLFKHPHGLLTIQLICWNSFGNMKLSHFVTPPIIWTSITKDAIILLIGININKTYIGMFTGTNALWYQERPYLVMLILFWIFSRTCWHLLNFRQHLVKNEAVTGL